MIVVAGDDKGKTGTVLEVLAAKNRVIVDDVNIVKKHMKPTNDNPGGIHDIPASIHLSNVMLLDPKSGDPTRVGRKLVDGKLERYSKSSGEIIR